MTDKEDAARYRWLKERIEVTPDVYDKDSSMLPGTILRFEEWVQTHTDNLDEAIDAELNQTNT